MILCRRKNRNTQNTRRKSNLENFYELLGVPFGWILYGLFSLGIHNYAVLIVIITLFTRIIMIPSSISQQKGMVKTQRIQSKIRKIQEKYAGDQRKIQEETQALYQREGFNPMGGGCAPMAIQFILLFGLIGVIYYPLSNFLHISDAELEILKTSFTKFAESSGIELKNTRLIELYIIENIGKIDLAGVSEKTVSLIKSVNFSVFGISLGTVPKGQPIGLIWLIPVLSLLSTIGTSVYSMLKQKQTNTTPGANKSLGCMTVLTAAMSLYFVVQYPAGIGIYWIVSSVFGLISSIVIGRLYSPKKMLARVMVDETVERRSRENNIKIAASNKEK